MLRLVAEQAHHVGLNPHLKLCERIGNAFGRFDDIAVQLFDGLFADRVEQILLALYVIVQRGAFHSEQSGKIAGSRRFVAVFGE